ncbi:MAG: zinc ribbon domain-containing protein, partial [Candidatus Thorarchaeota archaeon]
MPRVCPNCGQSVKDSAKFCKYCGTKMGAPLSRPVPRPIPTSRPPATVPDRQPITEVPASVLAQLAARSPVSILPRRV